MLLIIIYITICLIIIAYTTVYSISLRSQSKRQTDLIEKFSAALAELPLTDLESDSWTTFQKRFKSEGRHINKLYCYDEALLQFVRDEEWAEIFFSKMSDSYVSLAHYYQKNYIQERVYFVQHISQYGHFFTDKQLFEQLIIYMNRRNVVERESVLQALYAYGDIGLVKKAYHLIASKNKFHHSKLIADGLVYADIPNDEWADSLWQDFDTYPESIQIGIVKYIQSISGSYTEIFYDYLEKGEGTLDVRLNMIRYFRKYPYQPAYTRLLALLDGTLVASDEYRVVAAFTLAAYPNNETVAVLKQALHDSEWYVRVNASKSLLALKVPMQQLVEILEGDDRYAREMITYQYTEMEENRGG